MSLFVEPTDEQRRAAVADLSDADLIGRYWRLEDLTALTLDERQRLVTYRYDTVGFADYCEELVSHRPREARDVEHSAAILDRWDRAFYNLKLWHHKRSHSDLARNPIARVLIYEESRITGVRARLEVGGAATTRKPIADGPSAPGPRRIANSAVPGAKRRARHDELSAMIALAGSVADLTAAIHRLTDELTHR